MCIVHLCALYIGGKNVHYIHLNKVSEYCFVEGWMHK